MNVRLLLREPWQAVLQGNTASYCPPIDQSDYNMTSSHIIKKGNVLSGFLSELTGTPLTSLSSVAIDSHVRPSDISWFCTFQPKNLPVLPVVAIERVVTVSVVICSAVVVINDRKSESAMKILTHVETA